MARIPATALFLIVAVLSGTAPDAAAAHSRADKAARAELRALAYKTCRSSNFFPGDVRVLINYAEGTFRCETKVHHKKDRFR